MKKLTIMGGLTGFLTGIGVGLINDVSWPALFLRASVAAFAAGVLMRWWWGVWMSGLRESLSQRTHEIPPLKPVTGAAKK